MATPDTLGGGTLTTWFKAEAVTGVSDGASITAGLTDTSGSGHDVTVGVGTNPIYRLTGGPNSLPCIDHTAAAGSFKSSGSTIGNPTADYTYFAVVQSGSTAIQSLLGAARDSTSGTPQVRLNNLKIDIDKSGVVGIKTSATALVANTWTLVIVTFTSVGRIVHFDIGGTVEDYSLGGTLTFTDAGTHYGGYQVGSNLFNGKMAEIGQYSSVLSSGDLTSLKSYLNTKYFTAPPTPSPPPHRPTMMSRVAVQRASRW